jgi:hypothetical protein
LLQLRADGITPGQIGNLAATTQVPTASAEPTFSLPNGRVLHYIAPTDASPAGNDSNSGLDAAHPWATPNHPMQCGDVIIAAPGTYSHSAAQFSNTFGSVTNCPSTTGGIDGSGGIWFAILLCGGTDLMGCQIVGGGSGNPNVQMQFYGGVSNWAIEGFYFNSGGGAGPAGARTIVVRTCDGSNYKMHHFAVINNVITNSMQAFANNDCGDMNGTRNDFQDYVAAVGNVVQDANHNGDYQGRIALAPSTLLA